MKRSWLIGAALVFSLTAVGCSDDDEGDDVVTTNDGGVDAGPRLDGSIDGGIDAAAGDAGADAAPDAR